MFFNLDIRASEGSHKGVFDLDIRATEGHVLLYLTLISGLLKVTLRSLTFVLDLDIRAAESSEDHSPLYSTLTSGLLKVT